MKSNKQERLSSKVDEARKEVVERVLKLMKERDLSWIREWSLSTCASYNAESGRKYSGGNRLYLMVEVGIVLPGISALSDPLVFLAFGND